MSEIFCLGCGLSNDPNRTPFRCENANIEQCPPEEDAIFTKYYTDKLLLQHHVFQPLMMVPPTRSSVFNRRNAPDVKDYESCDQCHKASSERICSRCHLQLPPYAPNGQRIISILGGPTSGKTIFIASAFHQLQSQVSDLFHIRPNFIPIASHAAWYDDYYNVLFGQKETPNATLIMQQQRAQGKMPITCRMTHEYSKEVVDLTVIDPSGEDMKRDTFHILMQNVLAMGVIFIIDPLQLVPVREYLQKRGVTHLPSYNTTAPPDQLLNEFIAQVRNHHASQSDVKNKHVSAHVAVVLTKMDVILPHFFDQSVGIGHAPYHNQQLDMLDIERNSHEIETFLRTHYQAAFCQNIAEALPNHMYFGISGLGADPIDNRLQVNPACFRAEDPVLWLLSKFGLVEPKVRLW